MESITLPKFSWGKMFDNNNGHTKNEWDINNEEKPENTP
jgi:hypothetical protein